MRLSKKSIDPDLLQALLNLEMKVRASGIDKKLLQLIKAAANILEGIARVAQFIAGYGQKGYEQYSLPPVRFTHINNMPGFATIEADGLPQTMSFEIADGKVKAIYVMRNPDKLKHVTAEWIRNGIPSPPKPVFPLSRT